MDMACVVSVLFHAAYCVNLALNGEIYPAITTFIGVPVIALIGGLLLILSVIYATLFNQWGEITLSSQVFFPAADIIACTIIVVGFFMLIDQRDKQRQLSKNKAVN
ncbi:MAG: hypothetical protein EBR79_00745 [Proteobacteria bacterium]|nr:hypothetical protein [Pseudomonadota bacterium]NBX86652.1 hypothetical protein [Pseudomonadota bacterium]